MLHSVQALQLRTCTLSFCSDNLYSRKYFPGAASPTLRALHRNCSDTINSLDPIVKMEHYNELKLQGVGLLPMLTIPAATVFYQQANLTPQALIT